MMDPSKIDKMKVVELRAELQARGLDTKGVKAILVERLRAALAYSAGGADDAIAEDLSQQPDTSVIVQVTPSRRTRRPTGSPSPPRKFEQSPSEIQFNTLPQLEQHSSPSINEFSSYYHQYSQDNLQQDLRLSTENMRTAEKPKSAEKAKHKNPEKVVVKLKIEKYHDTYVSGGVEETPVSAYMGNKMKSPEKMKTKEMEVKLIRTPAEKKIVHQPMEFYQTEKMQQQIYNQPVKTVVESVPQKTEFSQSLWEPQDLRKSPEKRVTEEVVKNEEVVISPVKIEQPPVVFESSEKPESMKLESPKEIEEPHEEIVDESSRSTYDDVEESQEKEDSSKKVEIQESIEEFQETQKEEEDVPMSEVLEEQKGIDEPEEKENMDVDETKEESIDNKEESIDNKEESVDNKEELVEEEDKYVEKKEESLETKEDIKLDDSISAEGEPIPQNEDRPSRKRVRSKSRSPRSKSKSRSKSSRSKSKSRSESRSRSRSKSRTRSPRRIQRKSPAPNIDDFTNEEDEPVVEDKQFGLSWFDSDLHLRIDPVAFNSAKPLHEDAFRLVWAGVRTNYGVREGKVVYEVRLSEEIPAENFQSENNLFGFRAGFSLANTGLMLGEFENSFAYCSNGKKVVDGKFENYGKPFKLDDVIGCYLDLESSPCQIHFTLNGEDLGSAFEFEKDILGENGALFPHLLTKGYEFQVNFADNENLLANIERPTRRRKRERLVSPEKSEIKEEKTKSIVNDGDNWDDEINETENKPHDKSTEEMETEEKSDEATNEEKKETERKEDTSKDNTPKEENDIETDTKDVVSEDQTKNEKVPKAGNKEDEWEVVEPEPREFVELLPDYKLIALIPEEQYIPGPQRPESRKECEVYLMVGLPGSGKTHWVKNFIKENPEKRCNVIGADELIEKMKIDGKPRKDFHTGKWDKVYDFCLKSLLTLEEIATKRRRNYILDQTNVFASDQRRKMKGFGDFNRIAVVCIPNEDELKRRIDLKTDTQGYNSIKESSLNKLKANFTLPSVEFGWFDEVRFTDLDGDDAKNEVEKYNEKGKVDMESDQTSKYKRFRRDNYRRNDRRYRDDNRRYDDRGSRWKNNDRRPQNNRWGPMTTNRSGQWRDDRGYGGGNYDRRNDRYSSGGSGGGGGGQNWMYNNRQRYDDRFYRQQGSGRYDYGGQRDYRDHRYDRDRNGSNTGSSGSRRDSGQRGGSQRDFRAGHRDNRSEDSRGGYERSSTKYSSDTYSEHKSGRSGSSSSKSTNNTSANQKQWGSQQVPVQQQHPHSQMQMQQSGWNTAGQQQAPYWGYDAQSGYGTYGNNQQQQQQWTMNSDPRQQQQWANWWQQQGTQPQQQQQHQQQQYWTQYASQTTGYPQQQQTLSTVNDGSRMGDLKKQL